VPGIRTLLDVQPGESEMAGPVGAFERPTVSAPLGQRSLAPNPLVQDRLQLGSDDRSRNPQKFDSRNPVVVPQASDS